MSRAGIGLAALALLLVLLPAFAGSYALSVATLILYFAYTGQAWNVMMGFAGRLSLGHSLYVGVGAYAAGALFFHYGIGPWAGLWVAILLCVALGLVIGFLAFRFGISGVYFALLTIAFAEFTRIGFDHLDWLGGPEGMFLQGRAARRLGPRELPRPAAHVLLHDACAHRRRVCPLLLSPEIESRLLLAGHSRERGSGAGARHQYLPLEDGGGRHLGGDDLDLGRVLRLLLNNLFPEQIFHISRSIEIILGPVIGGIGTLFGPILGAAVLTFLSDGITELLAALGWEVPGIKQVFYGIVLLVVVMFLPHGIWPTVARKLKIHA